MSSKNHIFVVSLRRSEKRRERVAKILSGIQFEFFDATDGYALPEDEMQQYVDIGYIRKFHSYMTPGAIGCALSHARLYGEIARRGIDCALVLEDDFVLRSYFKGNLSQFFSSFRASGSDVMLLFYLSHTAINLRGPIFNIFGEYNVYRPVDIGDVPLSTVGYFISHSASASLSEKLFPVSRGADAWRDFVSEGWINTLECVHPQPIAHSDERGEINYSAGSAIGNVVSNTSRLIEDFRIPVLADLLRARRRLKWSKMSRVVFHHSDKQ